MSEPPPPTVEDFDHTDVPTDPGKKTQADIDREALVELGKRVTAIEVRLAAVENEKHLMRRLRKLMASWVGED